MGLLDSLTNLADEAYIHAAVTMPRLSDMVVLAKDVDIPDTGNGDTSAGASAACLPVDGLDCLPVLRWAAHAGAQTSRNDGVGKWFNPLSWVNNIHANLTGMFTGAGNGLWSSAAWLSNGADQDKAMKTFGPAANQIAKSVYDALFAPGTIGFFIAIPVFLAIVIGFTAAYTRQGWTVFFKRFAALVAGFAMFFAMGASASAHPKDPYVATPYWLASTAQDIVNTAGDGLTKQFNTGLEKTGSFVANPDEQASLISCRRYTAQLNADGKKDKDALADSINLMWEETGLRIWMRATYGTGVNASNVFCRILEQRAGASNQQMSEITNKASGGQAGTSPQAIAFWPSLMTIKEKLNADADEDDPADTSDQMLDRYVMMYDACKYVDGHWVNRDGFQFLGAIRKKPLPGFDVVGAKDRDKGGGIESSCQAAFTGQDKEGNDYYPVQNHKAVTEGDARKAVSNLVYLFDVNTDKDPWRQLIYSNGSSNIDNNIGVEALISQQHGEQGIGDITAAILFAISGVVALLLWGVFCGAMKILSIGVACFLSVALFLGWLIVAFAPERGRRAVMSAFVQMMAWVAGPTLIAMFASVGCLFVNTGMQLLHIVGANGDTNGGMLTLTLATIILPIAYILIIRYLCVNVWKIGDPFSAPGLAQLAGFGGAIKNGMKMAAGAVIGAGAAALTGGGAAAVMMSAGNGAMGANGRGGLLRAATGGMQAGQFDRRFSGQGGAEHAGGHGPSAADRAAVEGDHMNTDADKTMPRIEGGGGRPIESGADASASATPTARIEPDKGPGDGGTPSATPPSGSKADEAAGAHAVETAAAGGDGRSPVTRGDEAIARRLAEERIRREVAARGLTGDEAEAQVRKQMDGWSATDARGDAEAIHDRNALGVFSDMASTGRSRLRVPTGMQAFGHAVADSRMGHGVAGAARGVASWARSVPGGIMEDASVQAAARIASKVGAGAARVGADAMRIGGKAAGWVARHPNISTAAALAIPGLGPAAAAAAIAAPRLMHSALNQNGAINRIASRGAAAGRAAASDLNDRMRMAAANLGAASARAAEWMSDKPGLRGFTSVNAANPQNIGAMNATLNKALGRNVHADNRGQARAVLDAASKAGWDGRSRPTTAQRTAAAHAIVDTEAPDAGTWAEPDVRDGAGRVAAVAMGAFPDPNRPHVVRRAKPDAQPAPAAQPAPQPAPQAAPAGRSAPQDAPAPQTQPFDVREMQMKAAGVMQPWQTAGQTPRQEEKVRHQYFRDHPDEAREYRRMLAEASTDEARRAGKAAGDAFRGGAGR